MLPEIIDNCSEDKRFDIVFNQYLAPHFTDLRMAVGYFYLSGLKAILPGLKKNPLLGECRELSQAPVIRVLMSPVTDIPTGVSLKEGYEARKARVQREYDRDLAAAGPEEAAFLVDLLKNGKLEVRLMTGELFHAKAYLVKIERPNQLSQHISFVGSSNFSLSGLTGNSELNLPTEESHRYRALAEWFDRLWEHEAVSFNADLLRLVESSGAIRRPKAPEQIELAVSPFASLLFLGRHYFGIPSEEELRDEDMLAEFQHIGAENIAYKLERFGGAIVADSVGLGKTFTAGEIIRREYQRGGKILLLLPPHLTGQWRTTLQNHFRLPLTERIQYLSQGKLSWLSDEEISELGKKEKYSLIVIDEAHRARNSDTLLYRHIQKLHPPGTRAKILLLTATPFNNSVTDLKNLVNLITVKETLINAGLKPAAFDNFIRCSRALREGRSIAELERDPDFVQSREQIREILNRVMLLRMRSTIKERYQNVRIAGKPLLFFDPKVEKKHYQYDATYREMFEALPDFIASLHLPHIILSNKSGRQLGVLFQLRLFKRIESSLYAFYISLQNVVARSAELSQLINNKGLEKVLEDFNKKLMEREEDLLSVQEEELYFEEIDSALIEEGETKNDAEFRTQVKAADVLQWIDEDTKAIRDFIKKYLEPRMRDKNNPLSLRDEKVDSFLEQLASERWNKALVFTEFRATAEYLNHRLAEAVQNGKMRIKFAVTTSGDDAMEGKLDRFAPLGRGKSISSGEQLHLLISTDVLAEGVNLQDTDLLINYDLPWNPMRIVQRVGRANRIGSERAVRVVNFTPDDVLEGFLKLVTILESKIKQVALLLGKEMAILSSDDEVSQIRPEDIGEEIKRVQAANTISDYEELSKRSSVFAQLTGESDEDFFRFRLFNALRENRVRSSDFSILPSAEKKIYSLVRNQQPESVYLLAEVHGGRDGHSSLLRRVWISDKSSERVYPDAYFDCVLSEQHTVVISELPDPAAAIILREKAERNVQSWFDEYRRIFRKSEVGERVGNINPRQQMLARNLKTLLSATDLERGSFAESISRYGTEALNRLETLAKILASRQLPPKKITALVSELAARGLNPEAPPLAVHWQATYEVYTTFMRDAIESDPALRGDLFSERDLSLTVPVILYI